MNETQRKEESSEYSELREFLTIGELDTKPVDRERRFRFAFHLYVTTFVVVTAFIYGLSAGLNKKIEPAFATLGFGEGAKISDELAARLPQGVTALPVGDEVSINGKPSELVSFFTNRKVRGIVRDVVREWKKDGLKVLQMTTGQRGIALGFDEVLGKRYALTVWVVPPPMRGFTGTNKKVQGILTVQNEAASPTSSDFELNGEVPGVSIMPGGKGGAVVSSRDPGGRSYSSVYTNPGSISMNLSFYRAQLAPQGWEELSGDYDQTEAKGHGHLRMQRGRQELNLLFSPVRGSAGMEKTVVMVSIGGTV